MQASSEVLKKIEAIVEKQDSRYKTQAYLFVLAGLDYTIKKIGKRRHVSGRELSLGIRDFAKEQFGPTTDLVMGFWGLRATKDFGNIVYNLINAGLMNKTPSDKIQDFNNIYTFIDAFPKSVEFNPEIDEIFKKSDEKITILCQYIHFY